MSELIDVAAAHAVNAGRTLSEFAADAERAFLQAALKATRNNACAAARKTGIHRNTMSRHMQRLGIKSRRTKNTVQTLDYNSTKETRHK